MKNIETLSHMITYNENGHGTQWVRLSEAREVLWANILEEVLSIRQNYHHLEEWERPLKFVLFMDKRVSELEKVQIMDKTR